VHDPLWLGEAMIETKYMRQIEKVQGPSGETIERIFVKSYQREEIRFSWWPNGKFAPRPLDVTEEELLPILTGAIQKDIFSLDFLIKISSIIENKISDKK
jgi:hypothetical protein